MPAHCIEGDTIYAPPEVLTTRESTSSRTWAGRSRLPVSRDGTVGWTPPDDSVQARAPAATPLPACKGQDGVPGCGQALACRVGTRD